MTTPRFVLDALTRSAVGFIDSSAHPTAIPYYRTFPAEPVAGGETIFVNTTIAVNPMNFAALLANIAANPSVSGNVVVVAHGNTQGFSMPLVAPTQGQQAPSSASGPALDILMSDRPVAEKAQMLFISAAHVQSLLASMATVRTLGLRRLEIRACRIGLAATPGGTPPALPSLQRFFGAASVGAPDLRDAFARCDPGTPTQSSVAWQRWLQRFSTARVYTTSAGRFAVATTGGQEGHTTFGLYALAESWAAVQQFVATYLPSPPSTPYTSGAFPLHALWQQPLIFPAQSEYVTHIQRYSVGP